MELPAYLEYGVLYNHAAAVNWDVCPTGWHLSHHTEFYTLRTFLESNQGGKLKTTGTVGGGDGLWNDPNTGATNETGFSAKPGGVVTGAFSMQMGNEAHFWTPANASGPSKQSFYVRYNTGSLDLRTDHQAHGKSVRCVRD
ncbi:MAG: FISUMP domain-containing protein [Bacteroidetes bacterium]|nr:FISUMP domain-containing protein [Bacteroidota bacterium]MDA0903091.1 FISUMP domain-containing protein [Bacteroidota bacterium]MDA1241699.1 FISUMP domain-containing protein [Bacteroidota bacterium]